MDTSKGFMRRSLKGLRASDTFRVIRFSDGATEFSNKPMPATDDNILRALAYVDTLQGEGGTEMTTGIRQALSEPPPAGALRLVTFLTDGYIGNESEVLELVQRLLGNSRVFAFGVGNSVNRYLLNELGTLGRGFTRYMTVDEDPEAVADELNDRLDAPVLTDLEINWGTLKPTEVYPSRLPDLFAGQSIRVQGRYIQPGTYRIEVRGLIHGRPAQLPLDVTLPASSQDGEGVALIWARSAIEDAMRTSLMPDSLRDHKQTDEAVKQRVTRLGLDYSLITQFTSFVAITEKILNQVPSSAIQTDVPLPMADGVGPLAYGTSPQVQASSPSGGTTLFSGSSAPEPLLIGSLLLAAGASLAGGKMRKKSKR